MDGHKAPMKARFPRPTASRPFYCKIARHTKLLPVVQLRSGVIMLMSKFRGFLSEHWKDIVVVGLVTLAVFLAGKMVKYFAY